MNFKVTWTRPDGSRDGLEAKSAKEAVEELEKRGLHDKTPGLRIKDGGGISLTWNDLLHLAAQEIH